MESIIATINGFLWGKLLWMLIIGTGLYLSIRLTFRPLTQIGNAFKLLWRTRKVQSQAGVSPLGSLMIALSATIGTGNIVGVATAIAVGGPGALFWMWVSALLGLSTKYAETVCAIQFRETNTQGRYVGGPMYYIKNGMGRKWLWLAGLFAVFGALAGFGIGNSVQANSVAASLYAGFGIPKEASAAIMTVIVGLVLLGGIKGIARASVALVPFMSILYVAVGLVVIALNIHALFDTLVLVVKSAFTGAAASGGFVGATIALAIEKGVARGVFSNEAGLGSAPIAHAAAESKSPVEQGYIAMLGTFIDTLIVCSITGLAILMSGVWQTGISPAIMAQNAFASALPFGAQLVALSASLFAFTTILGWSYYGERCAEFLFGHKIVLWYRSLWVLVVPVGALMNLDMVWNLADILNGLMALPNLIALFVLSGLVVKLTRDHHRQIKHV